MNISPVQLVVSVVLSISIQAGSCEPFFSSKANITPVKLFHVNQQNFTANKRNDSSTSNTGSLGTISRVVPMKHVSKVRYNSFKNSSKLVPVDANATHLYKSPTLQHSQTLVKSDLKKLPANLTSLKNRLPKFARRTTQSPLIIMPDSWNALKAVVDKQELQNILEGLSDQVIDQVSFVSKKDPYKGQKLLLDTVISELGLSKKSRMLDIELDTTHKNEPVNKGVRFSAKQRRPVLNVVPLYQKAANNPSKSLEHWNISGVMSNDVGIPHKYPFIKQSSTTPTLLDVLAAPEKVQFDSTIPPFMSNANVFKPMKPISSKLQSESSNLLPVKSRVSLKDDEYLLPPITTTSTVSPEIPKGYQTITQSTTVGPKVIWYNHNQTPEDTFYPNSDGFLVPPDESFDELPANNMLPSVPHKESLIFTAKTSFPSVSSEPRNVSNLKGSQVPAQSSFALQHSSTNDFNRVREYVNKGNDDYSFSHSEQIGVKNHEIIPRHQNTNRKPLAYNHPDVLRYGPVVNEYEHYRDTYPAPSEPPAIRNHEISEHLYHNSNDNAGAIDFVKDSIRTYDGGRYKDEGPSADSDHFKREPKYKLKDPYSGYHSGNEYGGGGHGWNDNKDFLTKAKDLFKNTDSITTQKVFDVSIGVLGFVAFISYIFMLLYQVIKVSPGTSIGTLVGRGIDGAGEIFDVFFSKGPGRQAYLDEVENVVKRAMANVKGIWMSQSFATKSGAKVKGDVDRR